MKRPDLPALLHRLLGPRTPAMPARPAPPLVWSWPGLFLGAGPHGPLYAGPEHHLLVLGPPRSGKTTRVLMPAVGFHPGAVVATSTKADLMAVTQPWRARHGQCWLWDPTNTTPAPAGVEPLRWSPLLGCADWDQAVARAHALANAARPEGHRYGGETHWVERAQALLAPLLHAAALTGADMGHVLRWLHRRDTEAPGDILTKHDAALAADTLAGIAATDPRERSGIFSTADSLLGAYRTNATLAAARSPDFDPHTFANSRDTLYICAPSTAQAQHAALVLALLDHIRTATYQHQPQPPMLWALDELAHIAPLADLPATIAEGGSQGLVATACLQDLSQARTRWGSAADGFLTLFTHTLILPGIADTATLRQISDLAGEADIAYRSVTRSTRPLSPRSVTTSLQRRPRLPIDHIAAGDPNHTLLLTRGQPRWITLPPPAA